MRKPVFGVFDLVRHKPGCTVTCNKNKGADQLRGHREADLRLCFRICKKPVFDAAHIYMYIRVCNGCSQGQRLKWLFFGHGRSVITFG